MRIIHQRLDAHPKLCNIIPGDAVMVLDPGTGAEKGPFIVMAANKYQELAFGGLPQQPLDRPLSVVWGEDKGARILDPVTGLVYTVHGSTRARLLKNAAFVVNDHEEA